MYGVSVIFNNVIGVMFYFFKYDISFFLSWVCIDFFIGLCIVFIFVSIVIYLNIE